ncbi:MAG: beta-ketoacyl-[acyl-carrier-protein] synthase family protein [Phycisphaeraceae bacterium]
MSSRQIVITGVGPVSGLGLGIEPSWDRLTAGASALGPIEAFDASGFDSRIGAEVQGLKVRKIVPKSYRKATKVMARDIELAVAAADFAARDAGLVTSGTDGDDAEPSYPPQRVGAQIGAGLIAADLDELTLALRESLDGDGGFDIHKWGKEGMNNLTPLWLLKYLPNMLACHVTIIHQAKGPSNTITCNESSGLLSLGESVRAMQRGVADACFCGGLESKLNPMAFLRQQFAGRLNTQDNDRPGEAVRPFAQDAAGGAVGEGGGILILEARDTWEQRPGAGEAYAIVAGFGASQTVNREARNLRPDPEGRGIAGAIRAALADGSTSPDEIDLVVPFGCGDPDWDAAEASALKSVLGERAAEVPIASTKPLAGNCVAGAGALDLCLAAKAVREQRLPATINCDAPLAGLEGARTQPAREAEIRTALVYTTGIGGQNAAVVLRRLGG